jgi:chromosomal replication initiator protein
MENFWPTCLSRFKQELSAQQFNTWIKPLETEFGENAVRVLAPNKFVQQWVKERFLSKIETIAAELLPQILPLKLPLIKK